MTGVELFTLGSAAVKLGDVLTVGSLLFGAMGTSQDYDAGASAADYNAAADRMEANSEEERIRRESARRIAQQRSGISKSGVTMEGTPLLALAESAELAELDALNVRYTGEVSAGLYEKRAASTRKAKGAAVGASLLKGASTVGRGFATKGI